MYIIIDILGERLLCVFMEYVGIVYEYIVIRGIDEEGILEEFGVVLSNKK